MDSFFWFGRLDESELRSYGILTTLYPLKSIKERMVKVLMRIRMTSLHGEIILSRLSPGEMNKDLLLEKK